MAHCPQHIHWPLRGLVKVGSTPHRMTEMEVEGGDDLISLARSPAPILACGQAQVQGKASLPRIQSETQTEPGPEAAYPLGAHGPGAVVTAVEFPLLKQLQRTPGLRFVRLRSGLGGSVEAHEMPTFSMGFR